MQSTGSGIAAYGSVDARIERLEKKRFGSLFAD